jgi:hypothetical protein
MSRGFGFCRSEIHIGYRKVHFPQAFNDRLLNLITRRTLEYLVCWRFSITISPLFNANRKRSAFRL